MEWLTLVLLIPAILIPLVLLLGFSGCSFEPGRAPSLPASPVLISAIPGDETSITLSWANPEMASVEFEVERQPPFATPPAPITTTTFTDRFLSAGAEFAYTVRARRTEDGERSLPSSTATARTFADAFSVDLTTAGAVDFSADTLVQRFEPAALSRGGNLINVSMQAAGSAPLVISKVTFSSADPAPTADLFDSETQPVESDVVGPFTIDPGTTFSTQTRFVVDPGKPLLVAFDVGAPGNTLIAAASGCTAFRKQGTPATPSTEAALKDRTAFTTLANQVAVIPLIKVATEWRA